MIAEALERLHGIKGARLVEGAAALAALAGVPATPALYLLPLGDAGGTAQTMPGAYQQTGVATLGVLVVLRDRDIDDVELWRSRLIARLAGWQPADADLPIAYDGYALIDFQPGEARWLYRFRAPWRHRAKGDTP